MAENIAAEILDPHFDDISTDIRHVCNLISKYFIKHTTSVIHNSELLSFYYLPNTWHQIDYRISVTKFVTEIEEYNGGLIEIWPHSYGYGSSFGDIVARDFPNIYKKPPSYGTKIIKSSIKRRI